MMREEFEKLIGKPVPDDDYKLIEYVYTWYPTISNVTGKKQVATIYSMLGIAPFVDMQGRAKLMEDAETRLARAKALVEDIEREINDLKEGM